jgi:hypothetical protein
VSVAATEARGVEFIAENGGGPSVRLRHRAVSSTHPPSSECSASTAPHAPVLRSVGPEDEACGGHQAPGAPRANPARYGRRKPRR